MSGIKKRTIFYENVDGNGIKFSSYAVVVTEIGAMVEPFTIQDRYFIGQQTADYDATDEMRKIDEIQPVEFMNANFLSFGNSNPHHGGETLWEGK